jgi:hypothetical protein
LIFDVFIFYILAKEKEKERGSKASALQLEVSFQFPTKTTNQKYCKFNLLLPMQINHKAITNTKNS